jgi:hypothetical protein
LFFEQFQVLLHAPPSLINTVFNGVPNAREAFEVRGVEPEKCWIVGRFDDQRVFEINHGISPYLPFKPAAFRIALQVPVGISLAP